MGQEGNAVDKVYCCKTPFVSATQQYQAAIDAGKPERCVYIEGRGAETFEQCVASFRNGGTLGLVGGFRVLGASRKNIMARIRELKKRKIVPYDLDSGSTDQVELLHTAIGQIAGARQLRNDPRQPKRLGKKGGEAKGRNAAAKRNAILQEDIVRRLCTHPKLNWEDRAQILGENFSQSTLRRLYGDE